MKKVRCPRCGTLSAFSSENPWRPFCSERCKMIDLGAWASETYRVKGSEQITADAPEPDDESK